MTLGAAPTASRNILALVTDAFGGHGGIALYMRDVLRCVASQGDHPRITLIARNGRTADAAHVPANVKWDQRALRGKRAFVWSVLKTLARREQPDLILCGHIHLLPLAKLAGIRARVPVVLFIHGIDAWKPPAGLVAGRLVRSANLIVAVSDVTKQRFLSWSKVAAQQVKVLPNAVKLGRYGAGAKNPTLLARYGIEGRTVLMTMGRLAAVQRHKGVDEVIEVLPRLLGEFPELVYLVAGGGDDIHRLRQKADLHGIGERVVFTGFVDEAEKADHYRLADAFALTGRGDGFGFVLLEAMACGIPVAASVLDGSQEAILHGALGTLVNPDESESLAAGLSSTLRKPKGVPPGLQHFAYDKFCARLRAALAPLTEAPA